MSIEQSWATRRAFTQINTAALELIQRTNNIRSQGTSTYVNGNLIIRGDVSANNLITFPTSYSSTYKDMMPETTTWDGVVVTGGVSTSIAIVDAIGSTENALFHIELSATVTSAIESDVYARVSIGNVDHVIRGVSTDNTTFDFSGNFCDAASNSTDSISVVIIGLGDNTTVNITLKSINALQTGNTV